MIEIQHLNIRYHDQPALDDVNLKVETGEYVLLTGPSGCGKSTLAQAICGIIPHAVPADMSGSLRVSGIEPRRYPLPNLAQTAGMVFQNPGSQLFHLRVEDEVAFGPRNLGLVEEEVKARTDWALEATGLEALRDRRPAELSGGQKQCVAIASVLAMRPSLLVLDEPTASLDLPNTHKVLETLNGLRDRFGITILMIEHRLAATTQLVDRVLLMDKGKIVSDGSPKEVFGRREWQDTLGLRRPAEQPMAPWKQLIHPQGHLMAGDKPLLSLENISAGYNGHDVVQDVDLEIYPGDFLALVGPNGVGKSTLALLIAGLLKPSHGRVRYNGGSRPRPGLDVSLLFQNAADQLFTDSVDEEVAFGPHNYGCYQDQVHMRTLEEADLLALRERRPSALSVGQQQRTALAACLALRPRLVILDEPTLGQDWAHLQQLMDFLRQLNQQGTAVLLITHDYKLVHRYASRIILMEDGRVKLCGNTGIEHEKKG
jgi:energy-coupling factor transport system ATP-binding protein